MVKTSIKKLLNTRIVLIVMMIGLFGLGMASVPASKAYACGTVRLNYTTPINDSYGHNQGILSLHENTCNNTIWATFLSNTNTWKQINVLTWARNVAYDGSWYHLELDFTNWAPNSNYNAPAFTISSGYGYFAQVSLTDNKGVMKTYYTEENDF